MKLKDIGEFGFIDRIRNGCLIRPDGVVQAIGDDAAAFELAEGELTLVTTDLLVERVHFLRDATTGFNLGYKALAVNLSDIAAMGGTAREAFISIAVPADCDLAFLEDLYKGMRHLATQYDVNLLGGDTTSSKTDLVINRARDMVIETVSRSSRSHLDTAIQMQQKARNRFRNNRMDEALTLTTSARREAMKAIDTARIENRAQASVQATIERVGR